MTSPASAIVLGKPPEVGTGMAGVPVCGSRGFVIE